MKKYILTDDCMSICGHTVYRVKAIKNFGDTVKGSIGGYVENEKNLSQFGNCWPFGDSCIFENGKLCGNAKMYHRSCIFGNAKVCGNSILMHNSNIYGNAKVCGDSVVYDNAHIRGHVVLDGVDVGSSTELNGHMELFKYGTFGGISNHSKKNPNKKGL